LVAGSSDKPDLHLLEIDVPSMVTAFLEIRFCEEKPFHNSQDIYRDSGRVKPKGRRGEKEKAQKPAHKKHNKNLSYLL